MNEPSLAIQLFAALGIAVVVMAGLMMAIGLIGKGVEIIFDIVSKFKS